MRCSSLLIAPLLALALCLLLVTPALALPPNEEVRVNALLAALEQRTGTAFIRNGSEHTAAEAAEHLRMKLGKARKRLSSAEEFVDKVASSSSLSGDPYMIREPGQSPQPANGFLRQLLREVAP